jgi:hypothetical protein
MVIELNHKFGILVEIRKKLQWQSHAAAPTDKSHPVTAIEPETQQYADFIGAETCVCTNSLTAGPARSIKTQH